MSTTTTVVEVGVDDLDAVRYGMDRVARGEAEPLERSHLQAQVTRMANELHEFRMRQKSGIQTTPDANAPRDRKTLPYVADEFRAGIGDNLKLRVSKNASGCHVLESWARDAMGNGRWQHFGPAMDDPEFLRVRMLCKRIDELATQLETNNPVVLYDLTVESADPKKEKSLFSVCGHDGIWRPFEDAFLGVVQRDPATWRKALGLENAIVHEEGPGDPPTRENHEREPQVMANVIMDPWSREPEVIVRDLDVHAISMQAMELVDRIRRIVGIEIAGRETHVPIANIQQQFRSVGIPMLQTDTYRSTATPPHQSAIPYLAKLDYHDRGHVIVLIRNACSQHTEVCHLRNAISGIFDDAKWPLQKLGETGRGPSHNA